MYEKIAYTCITNPKLAKVVATAKSAGENQIAEEAIQKTKAYSSLKRSLDESELWDVDIRVDVITSSDRKRTELTDIIEHFKSDSNHYKIPRGILIIENLAALGSSGDIVQKNYQMLIRELIGIIVLDYNHELYSTVDKNGNFILEHDEIEKLKEDIQWVPLQANRGKAKGPKAFSEDFMKIYWAYEHYAIPESLTYHNNMTGKMSRVTFKRYCEEYEKSIRYRDDEKREDQIGNEYSAIKIQIDEDRISQKPKRFGKAPDGFWEIHQQVVSGEITLREACSRLCISEITYNRFVLKGQDRVAMGKATSRYKVQQIIDDLQP